MSPVANLLKSHLTHVPGEERYVRFSAGFPGNLNWTNILAKRALLGRTKAVDKAARGLFRGFQRSGRDSERLRQALPLFLRRHYEFEFAA